MPSQAEIDSALAESSAYLTTLARCPSATYEPGRYRDIDGAIVLPERNGQLQFHRAPHVIRLLAPGNGWGKTAALAVEVDWWGQGCHPYQSGVPRKPVICWLCQKHQQWEIMRRDVERWWIPSAVESWVGQPHFRYTWPSGATLFIVTAETDWTTLQGIQPDLVIGDESFPAPLWRELLKRRRGNVRTRYCLAATQTTGLTWMHHEIYIPWRKWHEAGGIADEGEMMRVQSHRWEHAAMRDTPGIWCWPQGSHRDNPTATQETWAFYLSTTSGSPAERHVRLYGGFREFAASPVFDLEQLERMRADVVEGRGGVVVEKEEAA